MSSKKIVIISALIFPAPNPRAYRATELAKEFAQKGHEVILYGVLGNYDYKNFEDKFNLKVRNIGEMHFAKRNSDGYENYSFFTKVISKLFGKYTEFPHIELMFKIPNIIKQFGHVDLLITIANPYPIHWGTTLAKAKNSKSFPSCWIADCGDPYMGNPINQHPFYFKYVEKWFCRKADYITIPIKEAREAYYSEFHNKLTIIPQGFDFNQVQVDNIPNYHNKAPTFIYAGSFYKDGRDPRPFLEYLTQVELDFKFIVYTNNDSLIRKYKDLLGQKLQINSFIPRKDLLHELRRANFLINFENSTSVQSPSKLIDYAIADRPILSINTQNLDTGKVFDFLNSDYSKKLELKDIKQYEIENVAQKFLLLSEKS